MNVSIGGITLLVLGLLLLWAASKILIKLLGFLLLVGAVVALMYYYSIGPFKSEPLSLEQLEQNYCGPEGDPDVCDCIIRILQGDLEARFSEEEWKGIESEPARYLYVLKKSLDASREQSMACLQQREAEEKYSAFLKGFVPLQREQLNWLNSKADQVKEVLEEKLEDLERDKDSIDARYP